MSEPPILNAAEAAAAYGFGRRFDEPFRRRRIGFSDRNGGLRGGQPAGSGAGSGCDGRPEQGAGQDSGTSSGSVIRESPFHLKRAGQRTAPDRMQVRRVRPGNDKGFFPKRFPQSPFAAPGRESARNRQGRNPCPERHTPRLSPQTGPVGRTDCPGDRYRDGHAASGPREKTRHTIRSRFVIKYWNTPRSTRNSRKANHSASFPATPLNP